jgi:hypothetical protein
LGDKEDENVETNLEDHRGIRQPPKGSSRGVTQEALSLMLTSLQKIGGGSRFA